MLANGAMLGRYRIEEKLGAGQSGVVFRAFDTAIERVVAIKCLRALAGHTGPDGAAGTSVYLEEARVVGQLNHPHVTAIFDLGETGGLPYIVMEYVQGETLKARMAEAQTDRASVPQVLSSIVMMARAFHYVHQRGILHGDIKPANLIITPHGTPKIMDFGVARRSQAMRGEHWSLAAENEVWGTPGYVAPERLDDSNQIDARADVFSLGVVAYEWLAGRKPFHGDTVEEIVKATLNGRAPLLQELGDFDAELSAAIARSLARNPAQRFDSADAMADALEICQERWFKESSENSRPNAPIQSEALSFPRLDKGRNVLFADFSDDDLAKVMAMSRRETYQAGDVILREGTGGSTMYIVTRGRVSVRKMSGTKEIEIKRVSRGECFGEMAVISQMPRSATVVALHPTEVVAISGAVLRSANQVLCMKLYRNIASLLADRMRQKDEQMVELLDSEPKKKTAKRFFRFWRFPRAR
jgi:serine/threonine-protein kinase